MNKRVAVAIAVVLAQGCATLSGLDGLGVVDASVESGASESGADVSFDTGNDASDDGAQTDVMPSDGGGDVATLPGVACPSSTSECTPSAPVCCRTSKQGGAYGYACVGSANDCEGGVPLACDSRETCTPKSPYCCGTTAIVQQCEVVTSSACSANPCTQNQVELCSLNDQCVTGKCTASTCTLPNYDVCK